MPRHLSARINSWCFCLEAIGTIPQLMAQVPSVHGYKSVLTLVMFLLASKCLESCSRFCLELLGRIRSN